MQEGVDIHFSPPLAGEWKVKIIRTPTQAEKKFLKTLSQKIKK